MIATAEAEEERSPLAETTATSRTALRAESYSLLPSAAASASVITATLRPSAQRALALAAAAASRAGSDGTSKVGGSALTRESTAAEASTEIAEGSLLLSLLLR